MDQQKIGLVANTTDPLGSLQIQFYRDNQKIVDDATSLNAMKAKIDDLTAQLSAAQAQYDSFVSYLTGKGADLTQPLTQAQIDAITADGYVTSAE